MSRRRPWAQADADAVTPLVGQPGALPRRDRVTLTIRMPHLAHTAAFEDALAAFLEAYDAHVMCTAIEPAWDDLRLTLAQPTDPATIADPSEVL